MSDGEREAVGGSWSVTGSLRTARVEHTATLLYDGRVLVTGGCDCSLDTYDVRSLALSSVEVYDPDTGIWSETGSMHTARAHRSYGAFSSVDIYAPETGTWNETGSLSTGRGSHTATRLPDGRVLVAGGWNQSTALSSAEIYDPEVGTWRETRSMRMVRGYHTATLLLNDQVL